MLLLLITKFSPPRSKKGKLSLHRSLKSDLVFHLADSPYRQSTSGVGKVPSIRAWESLLKNICLRVNK